MSRTPPGKNEQGRWLTDMRLGPQTWKPGDRIPRGHDALVVVDVRPSGDTVTLVVKGHVPKSA